jgi:hypothetical protein
MRTSVAALLRRFSIHWVVDLINPSSLLTRDLQLFMIDGETGKYRESDSRSRKREAARSLISLILARAFCSTASIWRKHLSDRAWEAAFARKESALRFSLAAPTPPPSSNPASATQIINRRIVKCFEARRMIEPSSATTTLTRAAFHDNTIAILCNGA